MNAERRREAIQFFTQKVLQLVLPEVDKYFLWSAESDKSIFNLYAGKVATKKTEKPVPRMDPWDNIWNIVSLSKPVKESLLELKKPLLELNFKLQNAAKCFLEAEQCLLNIAKEVSGLIQEKALNIFKIAKTLRMIKWINEVNQKIL